MLPEAVPELPVDNRLPPLLYRDIYLLLLLLFSRKDDIAGQQKKNVAKVYVCLCGKSLAEINKNLEIYVTREAIYLESAPMSRKGIYIVSN